MHQQLLSLPGRVQVPLSWEVLHGQEVSESNFIQSISQLPIGQLLPRLITLLQYGDADEPPSFRILDRRIHDLFSTRTARRISERLARENHWIFFSKWQLLLAIKLLCSFGSSEDGETPVTDDKFLDLLLMTNGFYPRGSPDLTTVEGLGETVQRLSLLSYTLIQHERPSSLIGRYSELFGRLPAPSNRGEFDTWVDIQHELQARRGIKLEAFKAVLFILYGSSTTPSSWPSDGRSRPRLGCIIPESYFPKLVAPQAELNRALEVISTSPDQIREDHLATYGRCLGNPVDLRFLLRKPAISLPDGKLAGISSQLLIQRYTCGLYWDINDALPDDRTTSPNRRDFHTFFGELHERYGRGILERVKDDQLSAKRKARLLSEQDYLTKTGSNPDNLLIETIGKHNTRCTLFEFKVGRPRYKDSIVAGDVQAFEDDVHRKIEDGLDQEIGFCQQLLSGQREIQDLPPRDITALLFVIVVTDPFPAMGILLGSLRKKLAESINLGKARRYGPFILSLAELEYLETLPAKRVSQMLIDWDTGPDRDWPFNTFYAHRTRGEPIVNNHISKLAGADVKSVTETLLGHSIDDG